MRRASASYECSPQRSSSTSSCPPAKQNQAPGLLDRERVHPEPVDDQAGDRHPKRPGQTAVAPGLLDGVAHLALHRGLWPPELLDRPRGEREARWDRSGVIVERAHELIGE